MSSCWNARIFKYENVPESNLLTGKLEININVYDFHCILEKARHPGIEWWESHWGGLSWSRLKEGDKAFGLKRWQRGWEEEHMWWIIRTVHNWTQWLIGSGDGRGRGSGWFRIFSESSGGWWCHQCSKKGKQDNAFYFRNIVKRWLWGIQQVEVVKYEGDWEWGVPRKDVCCRLRFGSHWVFVFLKLLE